MHRHNLDILRIMCAGLLALTVAGCFPKDQIEALPPPPRPIVKPVDVSGLCLEVKDYNQKQPDGTTFAQKLAAALAPIPADSPIMAAMADLERMRDQSRACKNVAH